MANNYTNFSAMYRGMLKKEVQWLEEFLTPLDDDDAEDQELTDKWLKARDIPDWYDDEPEYWPHFQFRIEKDGRRYAIWFYADEGGNLDIIAHVMQKFLAKFRPDDHFSMQWADTCSKLREDEFGGGAMFVTAKKAYWTNSYSWVEDMHKRFASGSGMCSWDAPLDMTICPEHNGPLGDCPVAKERK